MMTLNRSALIELLKELELTDTTECIRFLTRRAFQELLDAEAEALVDAACNEQTSDLLQGPYRPARRVPGDRDRRRAAAADSRRQVPGP